MKKRILVLLLFLSSVFVNAQNLFPLQNGNRYQYDGYLIGSNHSPITSYPKIYITDSMTIDQDTFYKFNGRFYRYDSLSQKLYTYLADLDTIVLSIDFTLPKDSLMVMRFDGEVANFKSSGQYLGEVFGEYKTMYKITAEQRQYPPWGQIIDHWSFEFAEDIGLIYSYREHTEMQPGFEIWSVYTRTINAAIIDTIDYNPHNIDVMILTNLQDRRINNFPFILRVGLSITDITFLDSLYADVEVIRDDSILVTSNHYNISPTLFQTLIELDSTILSVGDKIKIRCVATDSTIFENIASNPDSGFFEFTVLPAVPLDVSNYSNKDYHFQLFPNYPNPFNPSTTIEYQIPKASFVTIIVYDVTGKEIVTLVSEEMPAGIHEVIFKPKDLTSGLYLYKISTNGFEQTRKMLFLK